MIKLLKNRKRYRLFTGLVAFLLVCLMVLPGVFIHSGITAQAAEKKDIYYWERLNTRGSNYLSVVNTPDSFKDDLKKWSRVMIVYESQYFQAFYGRGRDLSYGGAEVSQGTMKFNDHVYSYITGCDFQYYVTKKHEYYSTLRDLQYWLDQLEDNDYGWNDRVLADDEEESLDDTEFCMVMPESANSAFVEEFDPSDKYFRTIGALGTPFIKYADKRSSYHYCRYDHNDQDVTGTPGCYYIALANSDDTFSGRYLACDMDGIYSMNTQNPAAEPPSSPPSYLGTWALCGYNNSCIDSEDRRRWYSATLPKDYFGRYGFDDFEANTFCLCWEKSTEGSEDDKKSSSEWHSYPINFAANILTMEGNSKYNENSKFQIFFGKKDTSISVRTENLQVASGQTYQIDRPLLLDEKKTLTVNKDGVLVISSALFLVGNIENRGLIIIDDGGFVSCGPGRKGTGAITCIGGDIVVNKWGMLYASPEFHPPLELRDGSSLINNGCCMISNMRTESGSLFRNRKGAMFLPKAQIQRGQEFQYLNSPYDSGLTVALRYPYTLVESAQRLNPSKGHYIFYSSLTFEPEKTPESKKFYKSRPDGYWDTIEKKLVWDLKGSVEELGMTTTSYKEVKGYYKLALYEFPEDKCYPPEVTKNSHIGRYNDADYVLSFVPIQ